MKKELGQHFLRQVPKEMLFPLDALEQLQSLQKPARVHIIEIGPGGGIVTVAVLKQLLPFSAIHVTYEAVDVDLEAIHATRAAVEDLELPKRFTVTYVHKDVLKHDFRVALAADYVFIFGSLPYNVSKKVVNAAKQFSLEVNQSCQLLPSRFVLQLEVAADYCSNPPNAAFLGTDLSLYANSRRIIRKLPPGSFNPPPLVQSAVLEINWKPSPSEAAHKTIQELAKVIRQGFIAKRKVINSVFKSRLREKEVSPTIQHLLQLRAHELSLGEWELLANALE